MTHQDPEPTPEQEAAVARLLREARVTEPMPADVAARLDGVLAALATGADLTAPPSADSAGAPAPVVPLEVRRRRRRVTTLLAAAAAVVAVGVGIGQLADGGLGSSDDDAGGGGTSQDAGGDTGAAAEDGAAAPEREGAASEELPPAAVSDAVAIPDGLPVGRVGQDLTGDAALLRTAAAGESGFARLDARYLSQRSTGAGFACAAAPWGEGALVPVLADGTPAVLAYRPPTGDVQVVDLLQCGTGETLRTTTLPAPAAAD